MFLFADMSLEEILVMDDIINVWSGTSEDIRELIFARDMISTVEVKNEYMYMILKSMKKLKGDLT